MNLQVDTETKTITIYDCSVSELLKFFKNHKEYKEYKIVSYALYCPTDFTYPTLPTYPWENPIITYMEHEKV